MFCKQTNAFNNAFSFPILIVNVCAFILNWTTEEFVLYPT